MKEVDYLQLKERHDKACAAVERSKGALAQLTTRLQEEFGCTNILEAKQKLGRLQKEKDRAKEELQKALEDYQQKWMENEH